MSLLHSIKHTISIFSSSANCLHQTCSNSFAKPCLLALSIVCKHLQEKFSNFFKFAFNFSYSKRSVRLYPGAKLSFVIIQQSNSSLFCSQTPKPPFNRIIDRIYSQEFSNSYGQKLWMYSA